MSANAEVTERTPLWRSPSAAAARSTGLPNSASPAEPAAKSATTAVELAFMGSNLSAGLVATRRPVAQCLNSQGVRTYHEAEAHSCQVLGGWLAHQSYQYPRRSDVIAYNLVAPIISVPDYAA